MSTDLRNRCGEGIQRALSRGGASLDAAARASVGKFIVSQLNANGGFRGRSAASDLYYTVFGLECARAVTLELPTDTIRRFVESKESEPLDFVHLTCLARCLDILWPADEGPAWCARLKARLDQHARPEGGHHRKPGQRSGSVYESFLGALANEAFERRSSVSNARQTAESLDLARQRFGVRQPPGAFGVWTSSRRTARAAEGRRTPRRWRELAGRWLSASSSSLR